MIIERLDLLAFGRFTKRSLDLSAGPRRFHIVYGPNESGKSTSLRAISDWLFGFKANAIDDYVHSKTQLRVGGCIRAGDVVIECIRRKGNKDTLLQGDNKSLADSKLFDSIIGGMDRETFEQQFGISHQQLVEGGKLILDGKGDLGEILFSAGAGLSRLQCIRDQLKERRAKIYSDRRSATPTLNQALAQWETLRASLREASTPPAAYHRACDELADARVKEQSISAQLKAASIKRERLLAINQSLSLFAQRRSLQERLRPIGDAVLLSPSFGITYRDLCSKRIHAEQRAAQIDVECERLRAQVSALSIEPTWLAHEAKIERLNQALGNYEGNVATKGKKLSSLKQTRAQIDHLCERMSAGTGNVDFDNAGIPMAARAEIVSLANQYSGVVELLSNAEIELSRRREAFRKLANTAKSEAKPVSPEVLENALRTVGNPQALLTNQSRAKEAVNASRDLVNAALHRLTGFEGTLEQAVALRIPPAGKLTQTAGDIEQAQARLREIDSESDKLDQKLVSLRKQIADAVTTQELPDPERLTAIRNERDRILADLIERSTQREALETKDAILLRDRIMEIDRMHELRHQHHDVVLRRESELREVRRMESAKAELESDRLKASEGLNQARAHWKMLWAEAQVEAGDVDSMRQWCGQHTQLLELARELQDRVTSLNHANDAIENACEMLRQALRVSRREPLSIATATHDARESSLFDGLEEADDLEGQNINSLYSLAMREREELATQIQEFEAVTVQLKNAERDKELAESQHQAAVKKRGEWDKRWTSAIEPLKAFGAVTPESIDTMLHAVDELAGLKRAASEIESELEAINESTTHFVASLSSVANLCLGPKRVSEDGANAAEAVTEMVATLRQTLQDQQKRSSLEEQLETLQKELTTVTHLISTFDIELQALCTEARCESVDGLAACEQASDERRQIESALESVENQLNAYAGGQSLDQFESEAAAYQPGEIDSEIQALNHEIQRHEEARANAYQAIGVLQARVEQMDGSDRAATLLQEQQNLLARIRREAEQYAKLTIAQDVLAKSIEHYRSQNEGAVLSRASLCFSRMTSGQYSTLRVDFNSDDEPVLYAVRSDGTTLVPANRLSDGTADALYLSMRIASLEVHLKSHRQIPLIVDDCLIQFDDERAAAALGVLSELSERTQVILFTHHSHLVDLAAATLTKDQYHLHELDAIAASTA